MRCGFACSLQQASLPGTSGGRRSSRAPPRSAWPGSRESSSRRRHRPWCGFRPPGWPLRLRPSPCITGRRGAAPSFRFSLPTRCSFPGRSRPRPRRRRSRRRSQIPLPGPRRLL